MLKSILSITVRGFFRNFNYSVVALSSLVIGISTAILIFVWARFEFTYDRQDPDADEVFLVMNNEFVDGEVRTSDEINIALGDFLLSEVPEVEAVTRIDNTRDQLTYSKTSVSKYGVYADSSFFHIFKTEFIEGSPASPFSGNNAIAISDELSQLLFQSASPIGKMITLGNRQEYVVSSVFKSFPQNNSLDYAHYVLPYNSLPRDPEEWMGYYIRLNDASAKKSVEHKIDAKFRELFGHSKVTSLLFSLTDWRLRWNFENGKVSGGRIVYVITFCITGLAVLLMACVNYVNLATARASRRAKEIGVRKMTGATRGVLIRQFLTESLVISMVASALSLVVVHLLMPLVRELTNIPLQLVLTDPTVITGLIFITLFTALIGGSYPAFLLSALRPAVVLKGNIYSALTGAGLRRGLVGFQFVLSIVMVFVALMMWKQTNFLLQRDVGYDKDNVINVWLPAELNVPLEPFREEVSSHTSIEAVAYGGASPMEINGYAEVMWSGMPAGESVYFYGATADFDMIPALKMKIIQGRNFSRDFASDSSNFVITKSAAAILGFDDPIGQQITYTMFGEQKGEIIGVIDDFNNDDIHLPIAPVAFLVGKPDYLTNMFVRYKSGELDAALDHVNKSFQKFQSDVKPDYSFLDSDYETQLYQEKFLGRLSLTFTVLAIIIAALGLFGLTLFNVERRTKEIGIRKVLGASVWQILVLLHKEFLKPVAVSFMIAFPVGYYLVAKYLEEFPFRVAVTWTSFGVVAIGAIALLIILVTSQSHKAAAQNPVESLKYE